MIIKNLSRKSASGQLVRYIFKYIFREDEVGEKESLGFEDTLRSLGIRFTEKDIKYLEGEVAEAKLMADFKEKSPNNDYQYYIQNYLLKETQTVVREPANNEYKKPFVIKHNIRSSSINGYIKEFQRNESQRLFKRSDQVSIHHTILSWSNKDKTNVSDAMLKNIAQEYIRLRGETNLYVGTVHKDRDHIHLHIAMSGTQLNGRSSRISKQEFQAVKVQLQEYQKLRYPTLTNSLPEHGKGNRQNLSRDDLKIVKRNERSSVKNELLKCLETITPVSTEHFLKELQTNGYSPYYRAGRLTGVQHEQGLKFRFSRLPVDMDKLKELDAQNAKENKELLAMQQLRISKQRGINKSVTRPPDKRDQHLDKETESLLELQDLRAANDNDRQQSQDCRNNDEADNSDDGQEREIDTEEDNEEENDDREQKSDNDTSEDDEDNDDDTE